MFLFVNFHLAYRSIGGLGVFRLVWVGRGCKSGVPLRALLFGRGPGHAGLCRVLCGKALTLGLG